MNCACPPELAASYGDRAAFTRPVHVVTSLSPEQLAEMARSRLLASARHR